MKAKYVVLILLLILVGLAVGAFALFPRSRPKAQASSSRTSDNKAVNSGEPIAAAPSKNKPSPPQAPTSTGAPSQSPASSSGDPLLDDLRTSYQANNLAVRIRIQDQLSKTWETNPPTVAMVIAEIRDTNAPAEYRIYFAKTLANRIKSGAYGMDDIAVALAQLRSIVGSGSDATAFRANLANVLTTVDQSGEAVQVIAPLLGTPADQTAVKVVAALCRSTNSLAIQAVYVFASEDQLLKRKPLALMAALGPLSTTTNNVIPIINRVIEQTDDFRVFAGSVQCLMRTPSSKEVLLSIAQASRAGSRFPQYNREMDRLCRSVMRRHAKYYEEHKPEFNSATVTTIEDLVRSEGGK